LLTSLSKILAAALKKLMAKARERAAATEEEPTPAPRPRQARRVPVAEDDGLEGVPSRGATRGQSVDYGPQQAPQQRPAPQPDWGPGPDSFNGPAVQPEAWGPTVPPRQPAVAQQQMVVDGDHIVQFGSGIGKVEISGDSNVSIDSVNGGTMVVRSDGTTFLSGGGSGKTVIVNGPNGISVVGNSSAVSVGNNNTIRIGPTAAYAPPSQRHEQQTKTRAQQVFGEVAAASDVPGAKSNMSQRTDAMKTVLSLEGKFGRNKLQQVFGGDLRTAVANLPDGSPGSTFTRKQRDMMNALKVYEQRAKNLPWGSRPPMDPTAAAAVAITRGAMGKPVTGKDLDGMRRMGYGKGELRQMHWAASVMEKKSGMSKEGRKADRTAAKLGVARRKNAERSQGRTKAINRGASL
jgi:hypothetical protein